VGAGRRVARRPVTEGPDSGPVGGLETADGRRTADAVVAELVRAGRLAEAEAWLAERLRGQPGAVAAACLDLAAGDVEIRGWDEVNADLTWLGQRGHPVTAVGLDLSNYHDSDTDDWWDKAPVLEVAAYDDSAYPFSTASTDELLAASAEYAAPWTGRMLGQSSASLTLPALRRVNAAVLRRLAERGSADAATHLGWWWQHLRFRQALVRHLDEDGLALTVPVLAGSHDAGPWLVTVHRVTRVADHAETTARILAERARVSLERYDTVTRETVDELTSLRAGSRSRGWTGRDKRRTYVELADARLALACRSADLPAPTRSVARMSDREFDEIVRAFAAYRQSRRQ
jgi:hypothetical protein